MVVQYTWLSNPVYLYLRLTPEGPIWWSESSKPKISFSSTVKDAVQVLSLSKHNLSNVFLYIAILVSSC